MEGSEPAARATALLYPHVRRVGTAIDAGLAGSSETEAL